MSNLIDSIIADGNIRPYKVIRLGIHGKNNPRPIKAVFSTPADVFEILKSKKKIVIVTTTFHYWYQFGSHSLSEELYEETSG